MCAHGYAGYAFGTNMEASFCKKQWNVVISSQANHLHLMSGCIMQSYWENKAKDVANYTRNMASDSDLN